MAARQAAAFLKRFLGGRTSASVAKQALPGAAINAAVGLFTGGPAAAVAYGAGDFLMNYPLMRISRKVSPGASQLITDLKTGEVRKNFAPSTLETAANFAGSLASPLVTDFVTGGAFIPKQTPIQADDQISIAQQQAQLTPRQLSQEEQTYQELAQRDIINRTQLGSRSLSPGTMYQLQGIEQTAFHYPGITLPADLQKDIQGMIQL